MDTASEHWHCCFCYEATDVTVDGLVLDVHQRGHEPSQTLAAHAACLAERLHPQVPFDAEAFSD
jgi:hypothetical protein